MQEGGGGKLFVTCGCLLFAIIGGCVFISILLFSIFGEPDEFDENVLEQLNLSSLTEEGKEYFKDRQKDMEEKFLPAATQNNVHWSVLAAIREQEVEGDDQDDRCDDIWIGPMKMKELNWSGNQFFNEFPDARTDYSHCGDVKDDFHNQLKEVRRLNEYRKQYSRNSEECEKRAREQKKEQFCQAFGVDTNDDQKADPNEEHDAIMSAANLLSTYRGIYGNLGQALNIAYGENEAFLRAVKNQILSWLKDPSIDGILRWPLNPNQSENKVVTKRGEAGLTIKSKDGETVLAVGSGIVKEVGTDSVCGEYVKLVHQFSENDQLIATVYCNLKEIKVKRGDILNIGDEIGKVKEHSLTIKMSRENEEANKDNRHDTNTNNNADNQDTSINPEEYLTAPHDVTFEEN